MMAKTRDTELVEQIAKEYDIETEALEDALNSLEESEQICQECSAEHDLEEMVDVRPRHRPDGSAAVLCADCWAREVSHETLLSGKEAQTAAYLAAGDEYTNSDIGSAMEMSSANVSQYKRRIKGKLDDAEVQILEAVQTFNAIDPEDW